MNIKYNQSFKDNLVKQVIQREPGISIKSIADSQGVGLTTLRKWLKESQSQSLMNSLPPEKNVEQWARWAKSDSEHLGYPSATPFRRLMGSTVATPMIDDETALAVGNAIGALKERDLSAGQAVFHYYWFGCNVSKTARTLGIGRNNCDTLVKNGTFWIDAHLNNAPLEPEMYQVQRLIDELSGQLGLM